MTETKIGRKFVASANKKKTVVHLLDTPCKVNGKITMGIAKALEKNRKTKLCSKCLAGKDWNFLYNSKPEIKTDLELKEEAAEKKEIIDIAAIPTIEQPKMPFDEDPILETSSATKKRRHKMTHNLDEQINFEMQDHIEWLTSEGSPEWTPALFLSRMYELTEPINDFFDLNVPLPSLGVKKMRKTRVADYLCQDRNEHGLRFVIRFNTLFLQHKDWFLTETLLHEMTHLWQEVHGKPPKDQRGHNKQFLAKMQEWGIAVNRKGNTEKIEVGKFTDFLDQHNIDYDLTTMDQDVPVQPTRVKKVKWTCECEDIYIKALEDVVVEAHCKACDSDFKVG